MYVALTNISKNWDLWKAMRERSIGGTSIGVIMGKNPYKDEEQLLDEWLNGREDVEQNEKMEWGNRLESTIFRAFCERYDLIGIQPDALYCYEDGIHHTPDGFVWAPQDIGLPPALVEIKNVGESRRTEWKKGGPPMYIEQLHFGMGIIGLQYGALVGLVGGQELSVHYVSFDEAHFQRQLETARAFIRRFDEIVGETKEAA